jgi:hypothetical protein
MSYDPKCEELALYFAPKAKGERLKYLSQLIQDTIEQETGPHAHECQQCGKVMEDDCDCDNPDRMTWCSSSCREAFDL